MHSSLPIRSSSILLVIFYFSVTWANAQTYSITGELKKWHKVTITFDGPNTSEDDTYNPFLNYRLDVTFESDGVSYVVPGYFAADGNAANTSSISGNKWRVHFAPDRVGDWEFQVSFRKGGNIAVHPANTKAESGHEIDGMRGRFTIEDTDKEGVDLRARGRLLYQRQHYLSLAETGEPFLKAGADAPENLLAYADFDGTFHSDGHRDDLVKNWSAHEQDWTPGDPGWQNGKGKGLIGAINYLAGKGMNAFSFLTLNIAGDDRNVFPYVLYDNYERFDCSKLDQWEIIFEHADKMGMFLHFKMSEDENQGLLDGGELGPQRKLYYRELIARFGHHLALNWNIGEENGRWHKGGKTPWQTTTQRLAMANFFHDHDPYHHHVVIHNGQAFYDIMGPESKYSGISLQTNRSTFTNVHPSVFRWRRLSADQRKPWAIAVDEPGDAQHSLLPDAEDPDHDLARQNALWGAFMAGAWGIEWYFGYQHAHSDLTCQDWRSRDRMWDQSRHCLRFFQENNLPIYAMNPMDELTANDDFVFALPGSTYIIYQKLGPKQVTIIPDLTGAYKLTWYNPRTGEYSQPVTLTASGHLQVPVPPSESEEDWVALITSSPESIQPTTSWSSWDRFLQGRELNEDPQGVFAIADGDALRISGEEEGYLISDQVFDNFRLTFDFRWGDWTSQPPGRHDSGVFYQVSRKKGDKTWPRSIEFQLQPGSSGDFCLIDSVGVDHQGFRTPRNRKYVQCPKIIDGENSIGAWNSAEIISYQGTLWHFINGSLVNHATDATLREGHLFFQSIGAEVFFRNISITQL